MQELTFGGMDAAQAYTWTPENREKLGNVVFLLYSSEPGKRRQAYIDYHAFKRYFFLSVWESEFSKLERFRTERGAPTIEQMIERVRREVITGRIETEPPIYNQQKEGSMQGLRKIGTGLITIGEGLIELAESGFSFGQVVPAPVEEVKTETKKAEKPKAAKQEKKVEEPAEEKTVDLTKLRDEVKKQLIGLIKTNRQEAIDLLAAFNAKKLPEVADDMLETFQAKLTEVSNG